MSNDDNDQLVLDAIGGRRPNDRGNVRGNCPFCESNVHKVDRKQCLSVNLESGYWKCYRCEEDGRLSRESLDGVPTNGVIVRAKPEERPAINLPEGFVPLWLPEGKAWVCKPAQKYLRGRRVSEKVIEAAKVGACVRGKFSGRVVIPIYKGGKLAGYVGRLWQRKPLPGARTYLYNDNFSRVDTLYNEDALYRTTDKPAIIVEGVFDTFPFWHDGVAVLGKVSDPQLRMMFQARRPLLIVFDGDAHREATALAMRLCHGGVRAAALRLLPGVDPDECPDHVKQKAATVFAAAHGDAQ